MLKKIACAAAAVLFLGSAAVLAEEENQNLLADYRNLAWSGDQLYYDDYSTTLYFANKGGEKQSASVTLSVEQGMTGFMFRIDGGNGTGGDSGYCTLTFYGSGRKELFGVSTGSISGLEYYTRFNIGKETSYYPIPEGAETVEIALTAEQKGGADKVHMYFRNLALFFSDTIPLSPAYDDTVLCMTSATGLSIVEIGVSPFQRYLWIGVIFLIAMAFFVIGLWRQKYKTAKVMKGTDWGRRR